MFSIFTKAPQKEKHHPQCVKQFTKAGWTVDSNVDKARKCPLCDSFLMMEGAKFTMTYLPKKKGAR